MSRCQPWRRGPMLARLQWICPVSRELTPAGHRGPLTGSRRRASLSHNVRDSHNNPPGTRRAHHGQRPSAVARPNGLVRLSGPPANQRRPRYQQVVKFIAKDVEQSHSAKASAPGETPSRYNALQMRLQMCLLTGHRCRARELFPTHCWRRGRQRGALAVITSSGRQERPGEAR